MMDCEETIHPGLFPQLLSTSLHLAALKSSNRALLDSANRYSISRRSPTSAAMFPRFNELRRNHLPQSVVNSCSIVLIPGALQSSNRARLDGTNRYSISRRSPTSAGMFPRCLMSFKTPSTPVRFVNSSSIELIPGASKSFNRALLDSANRYSIS
jgi:hypothetical protein